MCFCQCAEEICFTACREVPLAEKYKIYLVATGGSRKVYFISCRKPRRRKSIKYISLPQVEARKYILYLVRNAVGNKV